MRVSSDDIGVAFNDLLSSARSREEVASWASRLREADEVEALKYEPPAAARPIWEALEFLMGVDLKDGPGSYLHDTQDLLEFWGTKDAEFLALRSSHEG